AIVSGAGIGAVAVALAAGAGAAVVWRGAVVRAWPATAGVYADLGLPVNRVGLVIEGVRAEPALQDGHAALAVMGILRNVVDRQADAPPLRIVLYNAAGRRLAARIATPPELRIPPGGQKRFAVAIIDPPLSAHNLEVSFALGRRNTLARARPFVPPRAPPPTALDLKGPLAPAPPPSGAAPSPVPTAPLPHG
ncbi:MAG: DUF3426 domain-containing protein, partial [Caulobacteraceae bacterium]